MHFPNFLHQKTTPRPAEEEDPAQRAVTRADFRELAAHRQIFFRKGLELMATCLPRTDLVLQGWLEGAIEKNDALMFVYAISAAAMSGRRLPARLLARGAGLMRNDDEFGWIAWHCEGDVAGALLEAAREGGLRPMREAHALFYAAAWWQKHRVEAVPMEIASRARKLVRKARRDFHLLATLAALGDLLDNKELLGMMTGGRPDLFREKSERFREAMMEILESPFSEIVPQGPERGFCAGTTMRRAVEETGRNLACRCGSGKKYKRCCEKMDKIRWRQSSDVAGVTRAELGDALDSHLNKARLQRMEAHELAKLIPEKVPAELVGDYLAGLASCKRYRELLKAFKKLGVEGERESDWIAAFAQPVKDWRPDVALLLLKLHPRRGEMLPRLSPAARILLGSKSQDKFCRTVEEEATAALRSGDLAALRWVALGVLYSPMRALGLLVARSVLPLLEDGGEMFEEILLTRDKLNLSPDDEFAEFMEERAARGRKSSGHTALREAQERYEAKAEEARRLHEEKSQALRELALREKRAQREAAANVPVLAVDTEAMDALRAQVKTLEVRLRENSEEQVAERRRREKAEEDYRLLQKASAAKSPPPDEEEDLKVEGHQPVRVIGFPKGFQDTLAGAPRHVGRATMNRIGRLASGEPEAFDRVKQLKAYPGLLRARVSDRYRLLFWLEPDRVRVVDLIRRADLERRIESLKAGGLPAVA